MIILLLISFKRLLPSSLYIECWIVIFILPFSEVLSDIRWNGPMWRVQFFFPHVLILTLQNCNFYLISAIQSNLCNWWAWFAECHLFTGGNYSTYSETAAWILFKINLEKKKNIYITLIWVTIFRVLCPECYGGH